MSAAASRPEMRPAVMARPRLRLPPVMWGAGQRAGPPTVQLPVVRISIPCVARSLWAGSTGREPPRTGARGEGSGQRWAPVAIPVGVEARGGASVPGNPCDRPLARLFFRKIAIAIQQMTSKTAAGMRNKYRWSKYHQQYWTIRSALMRQPPRAAPGATAALGDYPRASRLSLPGRPVGRRTRIRPRWSAGHRRSPAHPSARRPSRGRSPVTAHRTAPARTRGRAPVTGNRPLTCCVAPPSGLEPETYRLTAERSAN